LVDRHPGQVIPSATTIGELLKRRGFALPRGRVRRRRTPAAPEPFAPATAPNAVWCIDFKGKFRMGNGEWCVPFTVTDAFSRFCIRCEIVEEATDVAVERVLDSAFREFGLPAAIRSDNGPPFAAPGPRGLTRLAVWLLRMGIRLERITPGKPQENGQHERFHLTLKEHTASPPERHARAQQRAFDLFRREFNEVRPHEAIGQKPPASLYVPSSRGYPGAYITPPMPGFGHAESVQRDGTIRWRRQRIFISSALRNDLVGLEPDEGLRWLVTFGHIELGHIEDGDRPRFVPAARPRRSHYLELVEKTYPTSARATDGPARPLPREV
jgi:transposase InsO family protein